MVTFLFLVYATVGFDANRVEVRAPKEYGNVLTPLHFGVNAEFFRPGIFAGTLPGSDPRSKGREFAAALGESGIRTLRLPGGDGGYYYLPENRDITLELAHAIGLWDFSNENPGGKDFVTLENLAQFARQHNIGIIYQLPMLFHADRGHLRASIRSAFSDKAKNYDLDRIDAQAEYVAGIAKRLRAMQAPVVAWELGNEEWAHCAGGDYARTAAAIVQRLRREDGQTPIIAVSGGDEWIEQCVVELRRLGVLQEIQSFNVHYPFGTWPGPAAPAERTDARAFVLGDLQITRWFDAAAKQRSELGIPTYPMAVTETMVFKFGGSYWDPHRVIGTQAHALVYAWNWMTLLADSRCNAAVFHDLESTYFGMLRYDVGYDKTARRFAWLGGAKPEQKLLRFPGRYLPSATCAANRMLSQLAGSRVGLATIKPDDPNLRILWGKDSNGRILLAAVNRSAEQKRLTFPDLAVESGESLTADDLGSVLPDQYRTTPLAVRPDRPSEIELPPWSVSFLQIHR